MQITIDNTHPDKPSEIVTTTLTPEQVADAMHVPVIAEIEPKLDPVYGHTFKWPTQEINQLLGK